MIEIKETTNYTICIKALRDVVKVAEDIMSCKASFTIEPKETDDIIEVTIVLNDLAYTYIGQIHLSTVNDILGMMEYKHAIENLAYALCTALREEIYSRIFIKKVDKPKAN